jgi:hypothetical protein
MIYDTAFSDTTYCTLHVRNQVLTFIQLKISQSSAFVQRMAAKSGKAPLALMKQQGACAKQTLPCSREKEALCLRTCL